MTGKPAQPSDHILARLQQLHPKLIDLSLGRMERLLKKLGNPETRLPPVIHIAGTNGKGSTLAYFDAMLSAGGRCVDSYISPHLVHFNERIRLAGKAIDEALDQFVSFLFVTAGAVLILALLIAFSATRITVEERRREHATMRAFGLPTRSVLGVVIKEAVIVGIIATILGLLGGYLFLRWMLASLAATTLPDVGIDAYISPTTILIATTVGIASVAVTPLLLARRLQRMNLPGTLRVVE